MPKRLDDSSRDLLSFRPNIGFVEPEQKEQEIDPVEEAPQLEDVLAERKQVKKLAEAVEALATAVQARVDDKAKGVVIALDPTADAQCIQCMRAIYPDDNPLEITYEQYKTCKDELRTFGVTVAKKTALDSDAVQKARDQASRSTADTGGATQFGGYNTPEAKNGGLRPELQEVSRIVDPVNLEELQINLICILANFIWVNLIKPVFDLAGIPRPIGISVGSLLPDELCDPGFKGSQPPGFLLLGKKKKKDQKEPPEVPTTIPEGGG